MSNTEGKPKFEPIKSVSFISPETHNVKRSVGASIKDSEDLLIDGMDWGMEHDYEYSMTIEARFKDSVLLLLLKDKFADFPEAKKWLEEQGVPFNYFVWS